MSILSTNHRLISIGESYSAGNGIDITDQVISVTGDATPYSAGENIDIQDHIISGKDWSQDITEASSHAYNETTAWVKDNYANSADMTYISAVVDTKLDASAWSTVSADYATEDYVIMADNITYNRATGYVDNQQFAKESACQSAFDYLDTNKLNTEDFTAWQNGQYATDLQTIEGQIANKYDTSSFAEVSGNFQPKGDYAERDFVLSSIESSTSGKLDVSSFAGVSGDFLTTSFGISESAHWEEATQAYEQNSGTYLTAHQSLDGYATTAWVDEQGYLTEVSIPESATWNEVSTTVQTNSAQWAEGGGGGGDPEVNSFVYDNSATINEVNTSYQTNSGTFLTAVDLSPYQTIEGMTAYQPAGSYATTSELEQVSADITATIPSTAGLASESYVQTNSAVLTGMIDGKQDTLTFGYDEQDRINSINSSALAGGGDVPTGTMNVSGLEYNAVGEISAYGNSAIAQYGAEKQWLVHDDTLVHAANSAQYALGVAIDNVARLMGVDETVLWSGSMNSVGQSATLSEAISSFKKIEITTKDQNGYSIIQKYETGASGYNTSMLTQYPGRNNTFIQRLAFLTVPDQNHLRYTSGCRAVISAGTNSFEMAGPTVTKVIGIGRKQ